METFNNVINSGQLVLVDFFATWCQPCKAMHPILEQVKSVLGDSIRIIKVDVDKYGVTASQYRIQSVPTLMLCRNGEVLWRTSGLSGSLWRPSLLGKTGRYVLRESYEGRQNF